MEAVSKTAIMAAAFRARASAREFPVCQDPWAHGLAGEEGRALITPLEARLPETELGVALRTAFLDRQVRRWTSPPARFRQVVVLGAGLDTRAARLARERVRFFEVDHPATLAEKRQRLLALDGYPIHAAEHVACDFEQQDFVDQLARVGFDAAQPALLLWEGACAYLSETAVRETLRRTAQRLSPFSVIIFEYLAPEPEHLRAKGELGRIVAGVGEPLLFRVSDVRPLLREVGFEHVQTLSVPQTWTETCTDTCREPLSLSSGFLFTWGLALASRRTPLTD